jgi:hypothetical protein
MLPLVLEEIVLNVKKQYELPEPSWMDEPPTEEDLAILQKEAEQTNPFDTVNFRKEMWLALLGGEAELLCRRCEYGKVVVIARRGEDLGISWSVWGRIFQGFGLRNVRVCWYASPRERQLPRAGSGISVGAEHVNGGYTMPCDTNAIVIYRLEEATRVLIHEMLHASCTDHATDNTEVKEAKTETWAELFLVAYASRGELTLAQRLWRAQSAWIRELNETLETVHGVGLTDYSARYTLSRIGELKAVGIEVSESRQGKRRVTSSRFTSAKLDPYLV